MDLGYADNSEYLDPPIMSLPSSPRSAHPKLFMDSQTILATDVQLALQHAVGEANNAFTQTVSDGTKKKFSKKRAKDSATAGEVAVKEKKRKRPEQTDVPTAQDALEHSFRLSPNEEERPQKKKAKKDKGKHSAQPPEIDDQIDPQLTTLPNSQAFSAEFLSALLTAASATAEQPHVQQPDQFHQPSIDAHPSQFIAYPAAPFSYEPTSATFAQPQQDAHLFPTSLGLPIPDLSFASNEDILRTIQEFDVSKIANVLKSLGDAAAAANVSLPMQPGFTAPPLPREGAHPITPLGQIPSSSGSILGQAPKQPKAPGRRIDVPVLDIQQHANPQHAHLLATKWMNASKLAELVKTQGLVYKKGKFSAIEEQQLKDAIENFRLMKGLEPEHISEIIFAKNEKTKDNAFWSEITAAIPQRPIIAVYHHVRRTYHPLKQQGKWMQAEDDLLRQAVAEFGQQWEKVSLMVKRMSSDCRDRYRNHIAHREKRVAGPWTKEEEAELTQIVTEMTVQQGKDVDNDVFWGIVSERMGNRRGRQQCRIKWTDSLSKTLKNDGQKPRWSQQDAYILVHKVDSLNVRDDTEIDWKTLNDDDWNLWSAHSLQRRWLTMKRSIKGYEDMTHQEIMDILRVKKAHLPTPSAGSRKRKVTSAAAVVEGEAGATLDVNAMVNQTLGLSSDPQTVAPNSGSQDTEGSTDSSDSEV